MSVKALLQGRSHRERQQGHDRQCQREVGEENQEIERPGPSRLRECDMSDMEMVVEIATEEEGRGSDGRDHAERVNPLAVCPDHDPSEDDQERADPVQGRVDFGEIVNGHDSGERWGTPRPPVMGRKGLGPYCSRGRSLP